MAPASSRATQSSVLLSQLPSLPQRLMLPKPPRGPKPVSVLEAEGAQLVLKAEAGGELQVRQPRRQGNQHPLYPSRRSPSPSPPKVRYPFLYSNVDALTLADVRRLLTSYKELVLKYEATVQVGSRGQDIVGS